MKKNLLICAAAFLCVSTSATWAQAFPQKPVRMVVPWGAGTPVDILARSVASQMVSTLGQPVVVEVRPGASGSLGAVEVLNQAADGHTLLVVDMPVAVAQSLYSNVPFNLRRDFAPIGQFATFYNVLVVHPAVEAASVADLVRLLRERPGKLTFASGGPGTPAHVAGELFKLRTGTQAVHVPYNLFPQAVGDLLGGQVHFMFAAIPPVLPHIGAGKLRPLAVTSADRLSVLAQVPTTGELGYPDLVIPVWVGLAARSGTPTVAVAKLGAALSRAMQSDEVTALFAKIGASVETTSGEAFGVLVDAEVRRWAGVAKAAGLKVE